MSIRIIHSAYAAMFFMALIPSDFRLPDFQAIVRLRNTPEAAPHAPKKTAPTFDASIWKRHDCAGAEKAARAFFLSKIQNVAEEIREPLTEHFLELQSRSGLTSRSGGLDAADAGDSCLGFEPAAHGLSAPNVVAGSERPLSEPLDWNFVSGGIARSVSR
jgi:hypothetical protein